MKKPIRELLKLEISNGDINLMKMEQKIASFLEFVNSEIKAFDIKTGKPRRLSFADMVKMSYTRKADNKKINITVISPRFINGKYVADSIAYLV